MKITGKDPVARLYRAVNNYLESRNGSAEVIGGIQIQEHPDGSFYVAVFVTGKVPDFARSEETHVSR